MAQIDKTDWYWDGELAGAVNNLYYDLINVDPVPVPYATNHRNSSFFLKTRLGYAPQVNWAQASNYLNVDWDITDAHIIRDEKCSNVSGRLYLMGRRLDGGDVKRRIFYTDIKDGCIQPFEDDEGHPNILHHSFETTVNGCGDWKFLVTDYVKGTKIDQTAALDYSSTSPLTGRNGVQINKVEGGKTVGMFADKDTLGHYARWKSNLIGQYILVSASKNTDTSGFAGQVRLVVDISADGEKLILDSPWLGFTVPENGDIVSGDGLTYSFFPDRGEVIGFTDGEKIQLITDFENNIAVSPYEHSGTLSLTQPNIISVASANDKIFILTDNGFIHYSKSGIGYNKFYIDDTMFAGVDKISITAYRNMIIAFGRKHITLSVPDAQNMYWSMYNQSTSVGLWSRYSYNEYDGDLVFVSNDKRLLMLEIAKSTNYGTTSYGLTIQDVGGNLRINSKLASLVEGDECFIGSDNNNLKIFVNTKSTPYVKDNTSIAISNTNNTQTHIYKFNTLFKIWTEDYIPHFCLWGNKHGVYLGQYGIYVKRWSTDSRTISDIACSLDQTNSGMPVETKINAYLIENEDNGLNGNPKLFNLAKLNRLITTLGPGVYSDTVKIKITTYSKGIGYTYEIPVNGDGNAWLGLITSYYLGWPLDNDEEEKIECMLSVLQDSQKQYLPNCSDGDVLRQYYRNTQPWCDNYEEIVSNDYGVCINDKIYELAPTMPLVTSLGENQQYATQIKLELIGGKGDIICFGGWLAELYIAPLFLTGPDGEYQLQPNTEC